MLPADATPEAVINAFLTFARTPKPSMRATISAEYHVDAHVIRYDFDAARLGSDVLQAGTETFDGSVTPFGTGVVGGHLFSLDAKGWSIGDATDEMARLFGDGMFSFSHALVIEDLGRDAAGGHRLRVAAGLSLYPPEVAQKTQTGTDRVEVVVSDTGIPTSAVYSLTISGATPSDPPAAEGSATYTFSDTGAGRPLPDFELVPGSTMPPPADGTDAPSEAPDLHDVTLVSVPFRLRIPGAPTVTSGTVKTTGLGDLDQTVVRATGPSGAAYTVVDLALPAGYVQQQGALKLAAAGVAGEAKNLGATVLGQRILKDGPAPGIEAVLATASNVFRIRIYVFASSSIELGVAGTLQQAAVAEADAFLRSIEAR